MEEQAEGGAARQREAETKRSPREDSGCKIVVRITADERARLDAEAGGVSLSELVRRRVFAGGVRNSDLLRKVAALQLAGKQLERLAAKSPVSALQAQALISRIGQIIDQLAAAKEGVDDTVVVRPKGPRA